jgi:hypothetical protein
MQYPRALLSRIVLRKIAVRIWDYEPIDRKGKDDPLRLSLA